MTDTYLAVASLVTAMGTIASPIVVWQMMRSQKNDYKLALAADLAMKFDDRFNGTGFLHTRSVAATSLLPSNTGEDAEDVFDFLDTVGLFTRLGALDVQIAHSLFFHWINLYWSAGKHYIGSVQKDSAQRWNDFEWLYKQVIAVEKTKDPGSEDLKMTQELLQKQLRDEANLVKF